MLVDVDASEVVEPVDTSNAPGKSGETQRHSCPPSSSRVWNHVESQPTATDDLSVPPSGPYPDPPIDLAVSRTRGANSKRGLQGRNASLLTFSKKKGTLETLRRNRAVKDSEAIVDAEVLELLEPTSATFGSTVLHSGPTSLQGRDASATAAEQTSLDDIESSLLAEYEEQNNPCPPSQNIE
jgi:hypothetical protein